MKMNEKYEWWPELINELTTMPIGQLWDFIWLTFAMCIARTKEEGPPPYRTESVFERYGDKP